MKDVLDSTYYVYKNSKHVFLDLEKLSLFCESFSSVDISHWLNKSPVSYHYLSDKEKLNLLLIFNSTSFCYWGNPKWEISYHREQYDGSWAMIACILRAHENGVPIFDPYYRATLSLDAYASLLNGNIAIPLLEERYNITKSVAQTLIEKFSGNFENVLKAANGNAITLLNILIKEFPSFEDNSFYNERTIYFYKRAQLLIEDIYSTFNGQKYGNLRELDKFTACADYKLPQALRKLGILSYDELLSYKIDNLLPILHHSKEEVEIRCNTIWAVELIKQNLVKKINTITSSKINHFLWLMGQVKNHDDRPYHRTFTTAY